MQGTDRESWTDGTDGRDDRPQDHGQQHERQQHAHDDDQVYGITTAETSHTQEISRRQKQYVVTMLVRIVSVIVVISVPGISWPIKIGLCLLATIIPYVAVVRANGGPSPEKGPTNLMLGQRRQGELGPAQRGLPGPGANGSGDFAAGDFIVGERVFRDAAQDPTEGSAAPEGDASRQKSHERATDESAL